MVPSPNTRSRLRRFLFRTGCSNDELRAAVDLSTSDAADDEKPPPVGPATDSCAASAPEPATFQVAATAVLKPVEPERSVHGGALKSALASPGRNRYGSPQHTPRRTVRWGGAEYEGDEALSYLPLVDGDDMDPPLVVVPTAPAADGRPSTWGSFFARKQHGAAGAEQPVNGARAQQPVHSARGAPPAAQQSGSVRSTPAARWGCYRAVTIGTHL